MIMIRLTLAPYPNYATFSVSKPIVRTSLPISILFGSVSIVYVNGFILPGSRFETHQIRVSWVLDPDTKYDLLTSSTKFN